MTPADILEAALNRALLESGRIEPALLAKVDLIARNIQNRAGVRLLMACLLAKLDQPHLDVRKPYTEIGTPDSFSGRTYDERYLTAFIIKHRLPCNLTTAFLTPALRNRNTVLTPETDLVGRPREVYQAVLELLDAVYREQVEPQLLLAEILRGLIVVRDERQQRMDTLLAGLRAGREKIPLSAENIVRLIEQHLNLRGTSRLPVIIVAAAYETASSFLGEHLLPLEGHNAADRQTQALGDVQITLSNDLQIVTVYEMKMRSVTINDLEQAWQKLIAQNVTIQNYIFVSTYPVTSDVEEYAQGLYERTNGVEFVILDCISFLRHFLHLFYRIRMKYLDIYQALLLLEPDSSISQPIKEAFLAMRLAAESEPD